MPLFRTETDHRARRVLHLAERACFEAKQPYNQNTKLIFGGSMAAVEEALTAILGTPEEFEQYCAVLDMAGTPCEQPPAPAATPANVSQFPATRRG